MPINVPLPQMALYAGFAAGALGLLSIVESRVGAIAAPLLHALHGAWLVAIVGAAFLGLVFRRDQPRLLWPTLAVNAVGVLFFWWFDAASGGASKEADPLAFINRLYLPALFLVLSLVLFILTFRIGFAPYALFALCAGVMLGINFDSTAIGIAAFAALGTLMAVVNYIVQLLLDHHHDFSRAIREWRNTRRGESSTLPQAEQLPVRKVVWIWGFALVLTVAGGVLNYWIQSELTAAAYRAESGEGRKLIIKNPKVADRDRDLEEDVRHTIQTHRTRTKIAFVLDLQDVDLDTRAKLETFPRKLTDSFAKLRPPVLDSGRPCEGLKFKLGSIRTPCRHAIDAGNGTVQGAFNKRQEAFNQLVTRTAVETETERVRRLREAHASGLKLIDDIFDDLQGTADAAFLAATIMSGLSYLMLVCALVAAAQMVLGRAIYREHKPQVAPSQEQPFRLPGSGDSQPLALVDSPVMDLTDQSDPQNPARKVSNIQDWYVNLRIARRGEGTHMCVSMPKPFECFLQRLLTARLIMTRVAMQTALHTNHPPQISVPGDHNLVRIRIKKDQQVCFRMRDLAAFTTDVTFRSIYTTYVGAHFLGLGTFYGVAEGEGGHLILQSDGEQVQPSTKGDSTPAVNLLAWDRAHEFALAQNLSVSGVWFNDPSLKLRSASGCAVLDESCASRFPLASRIWRLFRYLVLPV